MRALGNDVKKMPWSPELDNEILDSLEEGYRLGTWFNRKFLLQGKQIKNTDEVRKQLGLDLSKKTAVVFSHVLWDATFFYGKNLFEDYEKMVNGNNTGCSEKLFSKLGYKTASRSCLENEIRIIPANCAM